MNNSEFYNTLSQNYDRMINFKNSLKNKESKLKLFIEENYQSALDLGCGTGADSIALSKLGLNVDAVDHSKEMLKIAKQNSLTINSQVNFINSNLSTLPIFHKKYDLIVSLGNTIANLNKNELDSAVDLIQYLLNENGKILFQIVNYAKLPNKGEFILNKYEDENYSITRKYIIHDSHLDFKIDTLELSSGKLESITTKIFPYKKDTFLNYARSYNLEINLFGNLNKDEYIENESPNLIIEMRKK